MTDSPSFTFTRSAKKDSINNGFGSTFDPPKLDESEEEVEFG